MAVNWRDIQEKAEAFVHEWKGTTDEDKWAKPFWTQFFNEVFGIRTRSLGIFEERVKLLSGRSGKIDFFAPNRFLVEHKTQGRDLSAAFTQAADYFDALSEDEKPRYIIVSDFARFRIYDLEAPAHGRETEFPLVELPRHVKDFHFLTDEKVINYKEEDPINVRAVRAIGKLYEALKESNYPPESISPLLTRLVFCFFADDTGIFNRNDLRRYLEHNTKEDGSDIGAHLSSIFQVLDTPEDRRQHTTHETLAAMPYVNGGLFNVALPAVFASRAVRDTIILCIQFDWSRVSPAIFGSMFQSVMNEKERHDLGAHYTSEENILKVINGLFLGGLKAELAAAKNNHDKLNALWEKVANITLLDPACGCGNFLVIAYRELRAIENEIIARLHGKADKKSVAHADTHVRMDLGGVDLKRISRLSVEGMHGIEIEPFPAAIAQLSLWLMDHMMNVELGRIFGKPLVKLPLTEAPHIVQGNALTLDWEAVVPKERLSYILGNPPFLGARVMSEEQKADMAAAFSNVRGLGELDFVTAWYKKAAEYIQGTVVECAFVSTNSVSQGEQVAILWGILAPLGVHILFAHRTFKWSNEATGKAAVYCVIIGFSLREPENARLFEYEDIRGEAEEKLVPHINGYLVAAPDVLIGSRRNPLSVVPDAVFGSMPNDAGQFLFDDEAEKDAFLAKEPDAAKFVRPLVSAKEFLQGGQRYCLWLKDASPEEIRLLPEVRIRVENVRLQRETSTRNETRELARTPYLWGEDRQPNTDYILIPRHSSENRRYLPMGFFSSDVIAGDTCITVPNATLYHFGILESEMHMTWMRAVAGRLKSDYRYSKDIVYNNFPWPDATDAQKQEIEAAAQAVLDVRAAHAGQTLAALYDPLVMPPDLLKTHKALDKAVDQAYGKKSFKSESERLVFLFDLYGKLAPK